MKIFKFALALIVLIGFSYSCTNRDTDIKSELQKEDMLKSSQSEIVTLGGLCPHHLTEPCTSSCFTQLPHECLNPNHNGAQKCVTHIDDEDYGNEGEGGDTPESPKPCEECEKCLACQEVKQGKWYFQYIHTCKCDSEHPYCSSHDPQ